MQIPADPSATFLDQVVRHIQSTGETPLEKQCWVVPTRRSSVFLRDSLIRSYKKTLWAPEILAIQDFIRKWVPWQFPEPLRLIFELYEVYIKHLGQEGQEEAFEHFYSWGEMLLRDFDELDKYAVDSSQLFSHIRDIKELETRFQLPEENQEAIERFWHTFYSKEDGSTSELQEKFLRIWDKLFDVYTDFQHKLLGKGMAYDGMAYKEVLDQLEKGKLNFPFEKIQFIGFNALSLTEEKIIDRLLTQQKAQIYWDVDTSYYPLEAKKETLLSSHPAKFIHEYHDNWKDKGSYLIVNKMASGPKRMFLTGVALPTGQAHYLGTLLEDTLENETSLRKHAIVLADEQLLFPVLYTLPEKVKRLNITMGYPLKETPVYHLISSLTGLLRNMRLQNDRWGFAYQDVLNILSNSYIQSLAPDEVARLRQDIHEKNWLYLTEDMLEAYTFPKLVRSLFHPPKNPSESNAYFLSVFDLLIEDAQERGARLESEYIFQLYRHFNRFREIVLQYQTQLSFFGYTRLLREALSKARIPFEGEPLAGLQVMGFLETRVLDFEHLYILGANEGNLPDTSSNNSFIPYALRKGFGLPTYEEKDTIYAYHFFRLIQRAQNVHIIYNLLGKDEGGTGELSRFAEQIRFYLRGESETPHQISLQERVINTPVPYLPPSPIEISQSEEIGAILRAKYISPNPGNPKRPYMSATALTSYLACPLRFYFRYIAGIREPDLIEERIEAGTFGSILHEALEYIYKAMGDTLISEKKLPSLLRQVEPSLKRAFSDHGLDWDHSQGVNFLLRDALQELCNSILERDVEGEPFKVVYLEEQEKFGALLPVANWEIFLNGTFDRVDWLPESKIIRIIDYKTGRAKIKPGMEMDLLFQNADYKEMIQGYFYAWLYQKQFPTARIQVAFYPLREIQKGRLYLNGGEIISKELLQEFEENLQALLYDLFTQPYSQVADEKVCTYCAYKGVCMR